MVKNSPLNMPESPLLWRMDCNLAGLDPVSTLRADYLPDPGKSLSFSREAGPCRGPSFKVILAFMIGRKEQNSSPQLLGNEITLPMEEELETLFGEFLDQEDTKFEVFAISYPDEFVLGMSYLWPKFPNKSCYTFKASLDLNEDESPSAEVLEVIFQNIVGSLEYYFNHREQELEDLYFPHWQNSNTEGAEFFYQTTRENLSLSLQAEFLLQEDQPPKTH